MGHGHKVRCVFCQRSGETGATGALLTKDEVTAHQKCLLFSSGIFCRNSPEFDDLFGFTVEDVKDEVKRGSKLRCHKCKKMGATAGCEDRRCKKSFHYPCAVQGGAMIVEDTDKGNYGLYCFYHYEKQQKTCTSVNGYVSSSPKPSTSTNPSEAGPSKVYCLTCEKTEGHISLDNLSNSIIILYCDKHAPQSHKRNASGDSAAAGPSVYSSDSNSSSSTKGFFSKRRLSSTDKQHSLPSKRRSESWNGMITDDSSDSDENGPDTDIAIFAPIESDLEGSANFVQEAQSIRNHTESLTGCPSGSRLENGSKDEEKYEDETDTESESLLPPVRSSMETQPRSTTSAAPTTQAALTLCPSVVLVKAAEVAKRDSEGSSPQQSPSQHTTRPPHSPDQSKPYRVTSSAISPAPPEAGSSAAAPPSNSEPRINATSFWKSCNAAGCTQAIFTDFIKEMNDISSRIQADQASQEDYDLALTVMEASGKLAQLVTKQQKELKRKQMELQKAAAAMKEVVSALRK